MSELDDLIAERDEARQWARHGYEIGQQSCLWSDYGVAPKWLTEGWPRSFDASPLLKAIGQVEDVLMHYAKMLTVEHSLAAETPCSRQGPHLRAECTEPGT
jgi:hypothetical protein